MSRPLGPARAACGHRPSVAGRTVAVGLFRICRADRRGQHTMTSLPIGPLAVLRADLIAAEAEWDRLDAHGHPASTVRIRSFVEPRIGRLRRALAATEVEPRVANCVNSGAE